MSKKTKKISINKWETLMLDNEETVKLEGHEDIEITVRHVLPLRDMMQFVEDVVSTCIDPTTGAYIPEVKAFAIRSAVLTQYANFTLPQDSAKQYELVYNTDVFDYVLNFIDEHQYNDILNAVDERIRHETAMLESAMARQIAELTEKVNLFVKNSEAMFGSVDGKDVSTLVKNLSQLSKPDEEKMVRAIMEAQREMEASEDTPEDAGDPGIVSDGDVMTVRKKKG